MNAFFLIISFFNAAGYSEAHKTYYPTLEACQTSAVLRTEEAKLAGGKLVYTLCAETPKEWRTK